jgi:hypothetical protein
MENAGKRGSMAVSLIFIVSMKPSIEENFKKKAAQIWATFMNKVERDYFFSSSFLCFNNTSSIIPYSLASAAIIQ